MTALIIITVFLIGAGGFALFRGQRNSAPAGEHPLEPPPYSGLFAEDPVNSPAAEAQAAARVRLRESLLARAAAGETAAIEEAFRLGDSKLFNEALDAALKAAVDCQDGLRPLVSCIVQSKELRANPRLAEAVLQQWRASPNSISAPEVLHVAALSDDAATFQNALEALVFRAPNSLPASKLRDLIESEYWVLSSEARRSPAGFLLKRRIATARTELQKTASRIGG